MERLINNPYISLIGPILAIVTIIQLIVAVMVYAKNRKENREFEEKHKKVINHLNDEINFEEKNTQLSEIQEKLDEARIELEVELPKERRKAILESLLEHEKKVLFDVNLRIKKLHDELNIETETKRTLLCKLKMFLEQRETKTYVLFLVITMTVFYFIRIFVGEVATIVVALCFLLFIATVANKIYGLLKTEKRKKIIFSALNILAGLSFIFAVMLNSPRTLILFLAVMIMLIWFGMKWTNVLVYALNLLFHLTAIAIVLYVALLFGDVLLQGFSKYIMVIPVILECILVVFNIVMIGKYSQ